MISQISSNLIMKMLALSSYILSVKNLLKYFGMKINSSLPKYDHPREFPQTILCYKTTFTNIFARHLGELYFQNQIAHVQNRPLLSNKYQHKNFEILDDSTSRVSKYT